MEIVCGPFVDKLVSCLWAPITRQFNYLISLKTNVECLQGKMEKLSATETIVKGKLETGKMMHLKEPNAEVQLWLKKVEQITGKVDNTCHEFEENKKCLKGCLPDYCVRRKLSKLAAETIQKVDDLEKEGKELNELFADPKPAAGLKRSTTTLVGKTTAEKTLERVWESVMDDETRIIGLYGMGGIGKTTIMKKINDLLQEKNLFSKVIWVTVSKNFNLKNLQNNIATLLDLDVSTIEDEMMRADKLLQYLEQRKFALILDDVWEEFSLEMVGIPHPSKVNGCKLLLTTRKWDVCVRMNCQEPIKVESLSEEEAWELFKQNVGSGVNFTPEVKKIAMLVAQECARLPLAIITVGKAMRKKNDIRVWRNALHELKSSIANGISDEVLAQLKFSFECLSDDKVRECFLYCALFPEDDNIPCKDLVNYWIAEGLIDEYKDWEAEMDKGYVVLEELKNSCMLENVDGDEYVKMHDIIRDMAIHITSESKRFVVKAGVRLKESLEMKEWTESVERISLMHNTIEALPDRPKCPKLSTLFLQGNPLSHNISHSLFEKMRNLRVLNLSYTNITYLPKSLSGLQHLRSLLLMECWNLKEIPSLARLTELRVLNLRKAGIEALPHGSMEGIVNLSHIDLSFTRIEYLPESLWDLKNLHTLLLMQCWKLKKIPSLSRLTELKVLELEEAGIEALPQGIEGAVNLSHINLSYTEIEYLPESISDLENLHELLLEGCEKIKMLPSLSRLTKLRVLDHQSSSIEALPESLSDLVNLRKLLLADCKKIKKVPSLSRLTELRVLNLKFTSIKALPQGMEGAVNLRHIDLDYTRKLQLFPAGVLPNLMLLEDLFMRGSGWKWTVRNLVKASGGAGIEDIISLSHLGRLYIDFEDLQGWTRYVDCGKWQSLKEFHFVVGNLKEIEYSWQDRCIQIGGCNLVSLERSRVFPDNTRYLHMEDCVFSWWSLFLNLKDLVELRIDGCADIEKGIDIEEASMLSTLYVCGCHEMKNAFPLGLFQHLPNLKEIRVFNCKEIEEIAVEAGEEGEIAKARNNTITLPNLYILELKFLPKLKRLCRRELVCKSLEYITVWNCPQLKKLPFSVDNIPPSLEIIEGQKEWWDALEWDDPNTKILLQPFFIEISKEEEESFKKEFENEIEEGEEDGDGGEEER